jgi:hypothetical protein
VGNSSKTHKKEEKGGDKGDFTREFCKFAR